MHIRKLESDDALIWKKYRLESLKNHPENYLSALEEEQLYTDEQWRKRIQDDEVFGLFEDSELKSLVCFSVLQSLKSNHKGEIWGVYTDPSSRGKGYSSLLLQHVIDYAKTKVDYLSLTCTTTNTGAYHIYQKLGFTLYGTETKAIKVGSKFFDEYLMTIELKRQPKLMADFQQKEKSDNPTLHRFSLLKGHLHKNGSDTKAMFKDCIYHDVETSSIWQTFIYYVRLVCYYLFNAGRYQELDDALSKLTGDETQKLKQGLESEDIQAYMLGC